MFQLRTELERRNLALYAHASNLITRSTSLSTYTLASFPTGTDHGPGHLHTVEKIANLMLNEDLVAELSDHELFYLLLGFYYHDLGMVGSESQFITPEGRNQIRREHAIAIGGTIVSKWQELGFNDRREAEVLAHVCRGHRPLRPDGQYASWDDMDKEAIIGPGLFIRLRLVSALLYAVDELHIGADRALKRTEDFLQIKNPDSRRHWRCHQSINGPAVVDRRLAFEVNPQTPAFEDYLRRNVLAKAFSAYRDMKRELAAHQIKTELPHPQIRWTRAELWQLLVAESRGAGDGADLESIVNEVVGRYEVERAGYLTLTEVCDEIGNSEAEISAGIRKAVQDFATINVLVQDSESARFSLATSERESDSVFRLLRAADDLDRVFKGPYAANHEFDFYRGTYGRKFVQDRIRPLVLDQFGVDVLPAIPHEFDTMIGQILCVSITAARLVQVLNPAPSDLLKRRLLCLAAITGFHRDVLQNPELMLDADTRRAIYKIADILKTQQVTYEFFEELALISGLSDTQVHEVLSHSNEWHKEMTPEGASGPNKIQVVQQFMQGEYRPTTAFPYLLLAGQRSGAGLEFRCNLGSSLKVEVEGREAGQPHTEPIAIGVTPGQPAMLPRVDFRSDLEVDEVGKQVILKSFVLTEPLANRQPIVVRIPSPQHAKVGASSVQLGLVLPELTVGHWNKIKKAGELLSANENVELNLVLATSGEPFASLKPHSHIPFEFAIKLSDEFIQLLFQLDPSLPMPWFAPASVQSKLTDAASDDERIRILNEIKTASPTSLKEVTTFTLVLETELSVPFRHEFLRFCPGMKVPPPQIEPGGTPSQEELNRLWDEPKEFFKLETYLREDVAEVAESFRTWAREFEEFPVNIDSSLAAFHQTKTVYALERYPRKNRTWYVEVPHVVRLRPATRHEQLEMERRYWSAQGDELRCALIEEKLKRDRGLEKKN